MVVAPETNVEGAVILAERIRSAVEQGPIVYKEERIPLTVSLGFAVSEPNVQTTYDQLKHVAASALGEAKATGRNRSVIRLIGPKPAGLAGEKSPGASGLTI
jgi:diguanylate cyclase (GGDEF)-like protein